MTQEWKEKLLNEYKKTVGDYTRENKAMTSKGINDWYCDKFESLLKEERLAVLEEVSIEVENVHTKYFDGIASISEYQKGYLQAQINISTLINQLKVK